MKRAVLVLAVVLALPACGSGSSQDTTRDTVPPNVVPEGPGAWESITVRRPGGGRVAEVPAALRDRAAPLLTGRLLSAPSALAEYGLDAPMVTVEYVGPSRQRTVVVGDATFDGHLYYVQRSGDPRVFLVPAEQLDPLLALVGVT